MNTAMAHWDAGCNLLVTGLFQGLAHEVLNPLGFQQGFQVQGGDLCVGTAQFPGIHSVWQEIPDFHPAAFRAEFKAPFSQVRTASSATTSRRTVWLRRISKGQQARHGGRLMGCAVERADMSAWIKRRPRKFWMQRKTWHVMPGSTFTGWCWWVATHMLL